MIPDLSDQTFGTNLSGVAIKYKLMGFEQHVRNKERYFTKALKQRFELYVNFLSLKGAMGMCLYIALMLCLREICLLMSWRFHRW